MSTTKRMISSICWLFVCQILLSSCSGSPDNAPIKVADDYLNQQILLRAPDFFNTYSTSDDIYLELKYNSNNEIILPSDYNLRIFKRIDGNWIEIDEIPTDRFPTDNIVLSPDKEMPPVQAIFVAPDLGDYHQSYQLRIYVIGDMRTDEGTKEVAAYVDLVLRP